MAITTELLGSIGFIRGYASVNASPGVTYKLPPAPYGWVAGVSGSSAVTVECVDLSTGQTLDSYKGDRNATGYRTSVKPEVQQLATTVGIGVRFTGASSIHTVGLAPIGSDGDAYAMPPIQPSDRLPVGDIFIPKERRGR